MAAACIVAMLYPLVEYVASRLGLPMFWQHVGATVVKQETQQDISMGILTAVVPAPLTEDTIFRGYMLEMFVARGLLIPAFVRASRFKKHGYRTADRQGIQVLLWKPFTADALPPKWIRQKGKPALEPHKVTVTAFCNGWCPAQNLLLERAKRAASDPGTVNKVAFGEVDTFDRTEFLRWGISDALFINHRRVRTGPPPSYDKIRKPIVKQTNKLKCGITGNGTQHSAPRRPIQIRLRRCTAGLWAIVNSLDPVTGTHLQ